MEKRHETHQAMVVSLLAYLTPKYDCFFFWGGVGRVCYMSCPNFWVGFKLKKTPCSGHAPVFVMFIDWLGVEEFCPYHFWKWEESFSNEEK